MLNAMRLQGSWNQIKGQLKEHWGNLTDDDLRLHEGNIDQFVGCIQEKTGETRDAIERYLTQLTESGSSMASQMGQTMGRTAETATHRLREHFSNMGGQAEEGYDQARRIVRERPAQSLFAVFGVALGIGLLLGLSLRGR